MPQPVAASEAIYGWKFCENFNFKTLRTLILTRTHLFSPVAYGIIKWLTPFTNPRPGDCPKAGFFPFLSCPNACAVPVEFLHDYLCPNPDAHNSAWGLLLGVSHWELHTFPFRYTLQFRHDPPCFNEIHLSVTNSALEASILQ